MEIMLEYVALAAMRPYEHNPRRNEDAVEAVKESIRQFGFKVPIVLDADNVIIAGHTRYLAAKALGMAEVPAVYASDLTPDHVRAYRLADNKTAELSEWDHTKLKFELDDLESIFNMELFGFARKRPKEPHDEKPTAASVTEYVTCPRCGAKIRRWGKGDENE